MKRIDIPPVWLAAAIALAWAQVCLLPEFRWAEGAISETFGAGLIAVGLVLMALALLEFWRSRTTPVPHEEPSALITGGIFRYSRNPIYLGDTLILLGLILRWEALLALVLVPVFVVLIERRFIHGEEARLRAHFGEAYEAYAREVRRWA